LPKHRDPGKEGILPPPLGGRGGGGLNAILKHAAAFPLAAWRARVRRAAARWPVSCWKAQKRTSKGSPK
jgi:hypothetical protein